MRRVVVPKDSNPGVFQSVVVIEDFICDCNEIWEE